MEYLLDDIDDYLPYDHDYRDYDQYDEICNKYEARCNSGEFCLEDAYNMWNDDWPELSAQDYQDWEDEWREQIEERPWEGIWCGNLVNKVDRLMKSTSYKSYDPKHVHSDVANKLHWYDPIHTYAHNHGFKIAVNNIQKLIKKNVNQKVSVVIWKLKNHVKYKHDWAFREYANWLIEALLEKENVYRDYPGYLENFGLKIENGYLRKVV